MSKGTKKESLLRNNGFQTILGSLLCPASYCVPAHPPVPEAIPLRLTLLESTAVTGGCSEMGMACSGVLLALTLAKFPMN